MKVGLLVLAIAVVLGGLVGTLVVRDAGYVLVSYDDFAVETSLWFAVLMLLGLYFLIRFTVFLSTRLLRGGGNFGTWNRRRKVRGARQQTVQGLLLMAEGQWAEAKKLLVMAATEVRSPLINYLNAARAAHELSDVEGRDDLLRKAHETTPGSRFAVALTQAQLQISIGQWEQCLATLLQLRSEAPKHTLVMTMLASCYEELHDWQALIEMIPVLKKTKALATDEIDQLQLLAWTHRLEAEKTDLEGVFGSVPKELRRRGTLVVHYAQMLLANGNVRQAETVVRTALEHTWDDALVELYGRIVSSDVARQLVVAEAWLKARPNDAGLLLCLGRICLMNQQWAKAREYLEVSLRLLRNPAVYGELGRLCSALGDVSRGSEYLSQTLGDLPELPLPEKKRPEKKS
ncbi:MAG: heme biosynthesis protein HemY [Gammaproteobacteria bacterium]|nr:MAG: heme biosynthesis protein HemY [Gammaproteobacteria bacterium]